MSGTISFNDAVSASGLDPGAAPDWRSVAPSSARLSFATPQFSCTRNERDWFLYLAHQRRREAGHGAQALRGSLRERSPSSLHPRI